MRLTRSHLNAPLAEGAHVLLPEATAAHLTRVLRLGLGARFVLFNGDGFDYEATLSALGKKSAEAEVIRRCPTATAPRLPLVLAQAVARGDKMDFVLQKATELGVTAVLPLVTERTEVRLDVERGDKRLTHWRGVIASACEQCGRAELPVLGPVSRLPDWLASPPVAGLDATAPAPASRLPVVYLDPEADASLAHGGPDLSRGACFVIGPEGGLGDRDLGCLRAAGATGLRLGPRVLRTETAGLALLAAVQALHGDFND